MFKPLFAFTLNRKVSEFMTYLLIEDTVEDIFFAYQIRHIWDK